MALSKADAGAAVGGVAKFACETGEADGSGVAADLLRDGGAFGHELFDELFDVNAVALLEGGAEGLTVVREDDEVVGAGGPFFDDFVAGARRFCPGV